MKLKPFFAALALTATMLFSGVAEARSYGSSSRSYSGFRSSRSYSPRSYSAPRRSSTPYSNFNTNRNYSVQRRPNYFGGRVQRRSTVNYGQRTATYYSRRTPIRTVSSYRYGSYGVGTAHYYGGWSSYSYSPIYFHYIPFHPASFYHTPVYHGGHYYPGSFNWLGALFNLIALILLIGFVVWLIRRANRKESRYVETYDF